MNKTSFAFYLIIFFLFACGCSRPGANTTKKQTKTDSQTNNDNRPTIEGPIFEDVTAISSVEFSYRNGEEVPHLSILESLGGGVGLIDYDQDGLLDIYLTGGGYYSGKDKQQICGYPGKLYKNLGNFKFRDVTDDAGLSTLADGQPWFYSHGVSVADYDQDGWPDLLVSGWKQIVLFRNVANGTNGRSFVDVTKEAKLDEGITWATSTGFADFDGDGDADLFVCQYVNWSFANNPKCDYDGKTPDVCPPKKFQGLPDKLYRNNGDGTFTDISKEAGLQPGGEGSKALGVILVDCNLDGKPDIYVANDTVENYLYINESKDGNITLQEQALLAGVALDGNGAANGSMGLDAGDPEGTGKPYLWVTNYENELHSLYRNISKKNQAIFTFHTPASGIAAIGQKFVAWGTGFVDLDHHGWEDLFIATGHAIRFPTGAPRRQRPLLMRNWQGKFVDISKYGGSYFQTEHLARGAALGDLNNDGRIDLVVSHMNEPAAILKNVSKGDFHWLGVSLHGKNHADTVGARVIIECGGRKQTRFAKGGGSYASASDRRLLFGLGVEKTVNKLTVIWPNGTQQSWSNSSIDGYLQITQDQNEMKSSKQ